MNDVTVEPAASSARQRRRSDLLTSPGVLDLVSFLMTRPNCDQIAQHLVLRLMSDHHPRVAVISVFAPDATLNEIGMFGMSTATLEMYRNLALEASTPMTDAVRSGEPLIISAAEEVEARYSWMVSEGIPVDPLAVWPLMLPDEYVGGIQFSFTSSPDADALRADMTGLAAVLALYLSMLKDPAPRQPMAPGEHEVIPLPHGRPELHLLSTNNDPPVSAPAGGPINVRKRLTPRQIEVLTLMGRGYTNAQISSAIGFSESTISQETLEIYRFFGVHCRRDAVRMASNRGLIATSSG